jgi:hypothetical protein
VIPVQQAQRAPIFDKVGASDRRNIHKLLAAYRQKHPVALTAAPRHTLLGNQMRHARPRVGVFLGGSGIGGRRLRRHASPEKTSQIFAVLIGDEPIGRIDIVVTIVVEVDELGTPGPTADGNPSTCGGIAEVVILTTQ